MMELDERIARLIQPAVEALKAAGAKEVYLFGSAATGTMVEESDIDLAVSGLPPERFFSGWADAMDHLDREMDLVDLDQVNAFTRYLRERGVLLRVG